MKGNSGLFIGTSGSNISTIHSLTNMKPNNLSKEWKETTNPIAKANGSNRQTFKNSKTGLVIHFDKGQKGKNGFLGKDHWHIDNPKATSSKDAYLDINGNPCGKGSKASHIIVIKGGK
ncbi:MAG: hypothetical protein IKH36_03015 [Bacilli bacterium]|jgi:hypothetical protein|nr:hypothetical protein [Bacilli bacterium]